MEECIHCGDKRKCSIGVVNTAIAIGCAEGIMKSKDSNLLPSNGGHISLLSTGASISLLALAL